MNDYNTGVKDCNGYDLYLGDTVILLNKGEHVQEAYWYPRYEIIWDAPRYKLKHIGGGNDVSYAHWLFNQANCNKQLVLCDPGSYRKVEQREDAAETQLIEDRDYYHEWADKLAHAIGELLNEDIGEHSSANNPWLKALELVDIELSNKVEEEKERADDLDYRINQNRLLLNVYRQSPSMFKIQYSVGDEWVNCTEDDLVHFDDRVHRLVTKESPLILDEY